MKRVYDCPRTSCEIEQLGMQTTQLHRLRKTIDYALNTPFYNPRLLTIGITGGNDITSLRDIETIPFTYKTDLREQYPLGMMAVEAQQVIRLLCSSGTSGTATAIYYTQEDIHAWTECTAEHFRACGVSALDCALNCLSYGSATAAHNFQQAAERVGIMTIPFGYVSAEMQLKALLFFNATVIFAYPSNLLYLMAYMKKEGIDPKQLSLTKALVIGEPLSAATRAKIEIFFGIEVYNFYGLSEASGFSAECSAQNGLHIAEEAYLVEVIDPDTCAVLPDGQVGEIVITTLARNAMPLLRYRTHDVSRILPNTCSCGSILRRIDSQLARSDDMINLNSMHIFPREIEQIMMSHPAVGENYCIGIQDEEGETFSITVYGEIAHGIAMDPVDQEKITRELYHTIIQTIEGFDDFFKECLKVRLCQPGTLPVNNGKLHRIIDKRK